MIAKPGRFLLLLLAFCAGCASAPPGERRVRTLELSSTVSRPATYQGLPLYSGQLVLSEAGSPTSLLFALFVEDFSPYVHAGILVMERGEPIVYEARGRVKLEPGTVPTDSIEGRIVRQPLNRLLRRQNYVAIYDPPTGVDVAAMVRYVRERHQERLPFDPYFNTEDRSQVYCTEFVALALEAGGASAPALTPMRRNASIAVVREWLNIRSDSIILAESMIAPARHVATLSRRMSPSGLRLYQAAKRELHRRFSADQKLGNVFSWDGGRLLYRAGIEQFLSRAVRLQPDAGEMTDAQAGESVERLARTMFGPYPATTGLVASDREGQVRGGKRSAIHQP